MRDSVGSTGASAGKSPSANPLAKGLGKMRQATASNRKNALRSRHALAAIVVAGAAATPALAQSYTENILGSFNGNDGSGLYDADGLILVNGTLYGTADSGTGPGYVFSEPLSGGTPTAMYSFTNGADGELPQAGLTLSADGTTLYGTTYGGQSVNQTNAGSVFSIPVSGGSPTILYTFTAAGSLTFGRNPEYGSLLLSGNTLYDTVSLGGASNAGLVYSIPTSGGTPTILYQFTGSTNPSRGRPDGGLALYGSTLYGSTNGGGAYNDGFIYSMPITGGTPTILASFNGTNGARPDFTPTLSTDGSTLYGVSFAGGASGDGTVFSVPTSGGTINTLVSFTGISGSDPGYDPSCKLLLIGSTLYGTTQFGGASNDGEVFSIPVTGGTPTVLYTFTGPTADGKSPFGGLNTDDKVNWNTDSGAWDAATFNWKGNLYGTTQLGGANNDGTIFQIAGPLTYMDGDQVTMGSTITANSTVTVQSAGVAPAGITINNTTGFTYTFTGGAITGTGTLAVTAGTTVLAGSNTYTGGTSVNGGTLIVGTQNAIPAGSALNIASGATVATNATSPNFGNIASPDITLSSLSVTGTLDLNQSPMVVNYTSASPLSVIVTGITAGNITSSIVKASPTIYGIGTKDTGSSVQVMPTLLGDTTLSGSVGLQDYATVVKNFNMTGMSWTQGSFDYTGTVGLADYADVVRNFNQSIGASPSLSPSLSPSFKTYAVSSGATAAVQPALSSLNTAVELTVNVTTGDVHLLDTVGGSVLSGYDITSASGSLVPFPKSHGAVAGNSLTYNDPNGTYADIQNLSTGMAEGAASGTGGTDTNPLDPTAGWGPLVTYVGPGYQYDLGNIFKGLTGTHDLQFTWLDAGSTDTYSSDVVYTGSTPEPGSASLLAIGAVGLLARRRRK